MSKGNVPLKSLYTDVPLLEAESARSSPVLRPTPEAQKLTGLSQEADGSPKAAAAGQISWHGPSLHALFCVCVRS